MTIGTGIRIYSSAEFHLISIIRIDPRVAALIQRPIECKPQCQKKNTANHPCENPPVLRSQRLILLRPIELPLSSPPLAIANCLAPRFLHEASRQGFPAGDK